MGADLGKFYYQIPDFLKGRLPDFIRHFMTEIKISKDCKDSLLGVSLGSDSELPRCRCTKFRKTNIRSRHMFPKLRDDDATVMWMRMSRKHSELSFQTSSSCPVEEDN